MSFPTTNWTLLANATLSGDASGARALGALLDDYRAPVVSFLQQRGSSDQDANDLAHELFLELIQSQAWRRADQAKGRFRNFLLGILTHVITREQRRHGAEKRGEGKGTLSLDELADGGFDPPSPQADDTEVFDRQWALRLVTAALAVVAAKFVDEGKQREWAVLVRFLPGAGEPPSYEGAAAELAMTLPALKTAVHRVRQDFRQALRRAVARTVSAAHEIDDELAYLHRVLRSSAL